MYRYAHNLQRDIAGIVDPADNLVVKYRYDAWGKNIESPIATLSKYNPFKYRWNVYDEVAYEKEAEFFDSNWHYHCCIFNVVCGKSIPGLVDWFILY